MVTTRNRAKAAAAGKETPVESSQPAPARTTRTRRTKKAPLESEENTANSKGERPSSEGASVADSIEVVNKPTVEDTLAQEAPTQEDSAMKEEEEKKARDTKKKSIGRSAQLTEDEESEDEQEQEIDADDSSSASSDSEGEQQSSSSDEEEGDDDDELNQLLLKAQESLKGKKKAAVVPPEANDSKDGKGSKDEPTFHFPKLQHNMDANTYLKQDHGRVKIVAQAVAVVDKSQMTSKQKKGKLEKGEACLETCEINMNAHKVHVSKKEKKEQREKTAGKAWFDMPQQVLTPELKRDLQILKLRNVLDPKRFYKREEKGKPKFPKYFQVGTVIEGNTEFYSSRLTNKERATTITGEVMKDMQGREYYKRKFDEIQETKQSGGQRFYKKGDGKKKRNLGWKK